MAENTTIEWTDTTWNPVTGCTRISAGCDNCYARAVLGTVSRRARASLRKRVLTSLTGRSGCCSRLAGKTTDDFRQLDERPFP
jgi:protein gp37